MTQLFKNIRFYGHAAVFLLAVAILGIGADLASTLAQDAHHDFTIFAVTVPSLTIAAFIVLNSWSRPIVELIVLFTLGVLWLAMGAWSADIMGSTQCDSVDNNQRIPTKSGAMSAKVWCYEMKIIEAFAWMGFVLFAIFIWTLIALTSRAKVFGRWGAWYEPVFELPWFGQYPGFEESEGVGRPGYAYPVGSLMGYPGGMPPQAYGMQPQIANGGYIVPQQSGHSVVVRPGGGGGPPVFEQVPAGY